MFREALTTLKRPDMQVELDRKSLFALASDTRLEILRALQPMRRTVTQLAESLSIDKAAVHRHLKTLEEGGFVKRYEDHGFVYYGLSWKARDLISPGENTRVIVLLSASLFLLLCAAVFSAASMQLVDIGQTTPKAPSPSGDGDYSAEEGLLSGAPSLLVAGVTAAFIVLGAYVMLMSTRMVRKPLQRTAPDPDPTDV